MAIIKEIVYQQLERDSRHSDVDCTYDVIRGEDGKKYLQLDTYGSKTRKILGKKSQSLRLSPSAIIQLKEIIKDNNL